jgi:hypothetical protein
MGKNEEKRQLRKPMHIYKNNIKKDLTIWEWRTWIGFIWLKTGTTSDGI